MVARLSFREFDSSVRSSVRETREFQFVTELTTAKVFRGHEPSYVPEAVPERNNFRALHQYRSGYGFKSRTGLNFFQA